MAKRKYLSGIELQQATNIDAVTAGFLGLAAKADGMYIKTSAGLEGKIWHSSNDGTGSGLDADKLDGQEGTYYLDWNNFLNKPTSFPPSAHNHDDRYYTIAEADAKFLETKSDVEAVLTGVITTHSHISMGGYSGWYANNTDDINGALLIGDTKLLVIQSAEGNEAYSGIVISMAEPHADSGALFNISHESGSPWNHIPAGGALGQILGWESDGTAKWVTGSSGGSGTVTSVGLSMPADTFAVTGSPVNSNGTFDVTFADQGIHSFFAGPYNKASGQPMWRVIQKSDLPTLNNHTTTFLSNSPAPITANAWTQVAGLQITLWELGSYLIICHVNLGRSTTAGYCAARLKHGATVIASAESYGSYADSFCLHAVLTNVPANGVINLEIRSSVSGTSALAGIVNGASAEATKLTVMQMAK